MAVARNYRVLRGQRGPAARQKYLDYLAGLNQPDLTNTTPKNRPASQPLYVKPFGVDLGTDVLLETSGLTPSYNALKASVGAARVFDSIPATKTGLKLRSAKAARVSATTKTSGQGTYKKSKATGLWYIDYGGTSYSCPFGQGAANEKEASAFETIKTLLSLTFKGIHLIEEKI
jgi:hypothetical protein